MEEKVMPIQPTYPGVYIQEISSGVKTITGVATSIAAFLGRTAKGPINRAVRCTSYSDFLREFGGEHPLSDLADSVKLFFDNGGSDCYIVRIARGAAAAEVTLRRFANPLANGNVLTARAKAEGLWGQDIKLEVDYNTPNPDDTFNLRVSHETNGVVVVQEYHQNLSMNPISPRFAPTFVSQSSKLINLELNADMGDPTNAGSFINTIANTPAGYSQSRRVFTAGTAPLLLTAIRDAINNAIAAGRSRFIINVNNTRDIEIDLTGLDLSAAADPNAIAAAIQAFIQPRLQAEVPGLTVNVTWDTLGTRTLVLRITSNFDNFSSVKIRRASSNDIATELMLGLEQGGIEVGRFSNLRPVPNGDYLWGNRNFGDFTTALDAFAFLNQGDINQITVGTTVIPVNLATGGTRMYDQAGGGLNGVKEKLQIIAQAVNAEVNSPATAEVWGYHLAFKKKTGGINESVTVATAPVAGVAFGNAFVVNTRRYSLGALGTGAFQLPGVAGSDGIAPTVNEYTGDPFLHTGFYALDKVDLFNLMVIPGDSDIDEGEYQQLFGPATTYCYNKRAFLLLDAPQSWTDGETMDADASDVNSLRAGIVKDHAAIFYPRVEFSDGGLIRPIGASGMIAGLIARTDSQRGVWKAPAGTEADLRGVLDVELNLTDNENGILNKLGVNCIRKFPNGIVNWGARTLDGSDDFGSEWKYIPIRRLALFLEESLFRGTKWVVFEPNDEPLWAKIRLNITAFMMSLFRQGAFQGSTPDKAFFVKCDGETTTQNDRNLGIVNIQIGFAPLKPAEFVIITIQQMAGDLV
jgi:phage tail sheath protein FI